MNKLVLGALTACFLQLHRPGATNEVTYIPVDAITVIREVKGIGTVIKMEDNFGAYSVSESMEDIMMQIRACKKGS